MAKKAVKQLTTKGTRNLTVATPKKLTAIKDKYTQTQIIQHLTEETELTAKEIKAVFDSLSQLAKRHVMKRGSGEFRVPGLGVKISRKIKLATKKRRGRNPATGEEIVIPAKPKREVIRVTALKALKETLA